MPVAVDVAVPLGVVAVAVAAEVAVAVGVLVAVAVGVGGVGVGVEQNCEKRLSPMTMLPPELGGGGGGAVGAAGIGGGGGVLGMGFGLGFAVAVAVGVAVGVAVAVCVAVGCARATACCFGAEAGAIAAKTRPLATSSSRIAPATLMVLRRITESPVRRRHWAWIICLSERSPSRSLFNIRGPILWLALRQRMR